MMEHYSTIDYHTAGEPFRVVGDLPHEIPGEGVAAKRMVAISSPGIQRVRQLLCFEPRGHADMYGGFIVEPDDDGAHFGVLFWHKDGFSTACGHGTIALGAWAVETGRVPAEPGGITDVVIDVPSGRVTARVHTDAEGLVQRVDFVNVPSYVLHRRVPVMTTRGELAVGIAYGGAIYAQVDAAEAGLRVSEENYGPIIALGREVRSALNDRPESRHPLDERLSGIYGTMIVEDLGPDGDGPRQRSATVFADGQVDRSPCGSGTCARLATLTASGELTAGQTLRHESIVGSVFSARVLERLAESPREAVIPQVSGMAYRTGKHTFTVDPRDGLVPGFVLR